MKTIFTLLFSFLYFQLVGQLSWQNSTPAYPEGDKDGHTFTNVTPGASPQTSVSVAVTGGTDLVWQADNPRVPSGSPSRLTLGVNFPNRVDQSQMFTTFTFTFSQPVCGLQFNLYDIDRGSASATVPVTYTYVDQVTVAATTEAGVTVNPIITPSAFATVSGSTITGTSADASNSGTNVSFPFVASNSPCVKTLIITSRSGPNAQTNPSLQLTAIGDMSGLNNTSPLPVTLTSFKSSTLGQEIMLDWTTADESNFSHFSVERSYDAKNFEAIGRVDAKALANTSETAYQFVDQTPNFGINYYRLRQVDIDGSYAYSRIISANMTETSPIVIYPNPSADFINIKNGEKESIISYQIYDNAGRLMQHNEHPVSEILIQDLPSGAYVLRLINERKDLINRRFVKK